jgi:hypothetical protein
VQQHGCAHTNRGAAHGRHEWLWSVTDLPKKSKHRAVIAAGRVVHKILQVIAGGEHVALTDDHYGADFGCLARLNQGGGERAVHVSGDGVLLLRPI